jgi:hypothetical protein
VHCREWIPVPGAKRSNSIILFQNSLMEGCFLSDEVSSFVTGMKFGEKSANFFHKFYHRGGRFTQISMYFFCLFEIQRELLLPLTDFLFYTCLQIGSYIEGKLVIQIKSLIL